jgi:hypothetical protein
MASDDEIKPYECDCMEYSFLEKLIVAYVVNSFG